MSKRKIPETSSNRRKRQKTLGTLLQILSSKGGIPKLNSVIKNKLGIQNRFKVTVLLQALQSLDQNFTKENFEDVESIIQTVELSPIEYEIVDPLEKQIAAKIFIKKNTRIAYATSKVLLDCTYQNDPCVVKIMQPEIDKVELFIETIINIFISAVTKDTINQFISTPDVITMGYLKRFSMPSKESYSLRKSNQLILVQEKIDGLEFDKISNDFLLLRALIALCKGLIILQNEYNFAHRDFHSGNVMFSENENKAYIIDFGYSCFSVPNTKGSIQTLEGGLGFNQLDKDYEKHIPCINKSSDLCTLILSLAMKKKFGSWFTEIAKYICKKYKQKYIAFSEGWKEMHYNIGSEYSWNRDIFHFWYVYEMFEIDIGFGPTQLLDYLSKKFPGLNDVDFTSPIKLKV